MKEIRGDLWSLTGFDIKCITTNGTIKKNGDAVMGRGCAKEAAQQYPHLPSLLGVLIEQNGNRVQELDIIDSLTLLVAFPVKHNWWEKADIKLIEQSCKQLIELDEKYKCLLPRPGCGNGQLDWKTEVKPICEKYLGDNITIVSPY